MKIKDFKSFTLNEETAETTEKETKDEVEKTEEKEESASDSTGDSTPSEDEVLAPSDKLEDVGEDVAEFADGEDGEENTPLEDYTDYEDYKETDATPTNPGQCCKIAIINGCEVDSEVSKKIGALKDKCGDSCHEIHLYQLNIQTPRKNEPKDGMMQIYDHIEGADAIIIACQATKGKLSEMMETAISRIKAHYQKDELKNKVFGALIIGNDPKIKHEIVSIALNDLGMVICPDCMCFCGDKEKFDPTKMMASISSLASATASLRCGESCEKEEPAKEDIKSFDDYKGGDDEAEETDDYVDELKKDADFTEEEEDVESNDGTDNDSDVTTEEEENRVIDNQNGTITIIDKEGEITETFDIVSFEDFIKE